MKLEDMKQFAEARTSYGLVTHVPDPTTRPVDRKSETSKNKRVDSKSSGNVRLALSVGKVDHWPSAKNNNKEGRATASSNVSDEYRLASIFLRADEIEKSAVRGRPDPDSGYKPKQPVNVRLDPDVIDWLKAKGPRYQSRINAYLQALMEADSGYETTQPK